MQDAELVSLSEVIRFSDSHYDVRAVVDGRLVVRFMNSGTGKEEYRVWTTEERDRFDTLAAERKVHLARNKEIYERHLAGETRKALAAEFGVHPSRIAQLVGIQARKERQLNDLHWSNATQNAADQ